MSFGQRDKLVVGGPEAPCVLREKVAPGPGLPQSTMASAHNSAHGASPGRRSRKMLTSCSPLPKRTPLRASDSPSKPVTKPQMSSAHFVQNSPTQPATR